MLRKGGGEKKYKGVLSRKDQPVKTNRLRKPAKATNTRSSHQLRQLAASCGVAPSYVDESGSRRLVADASLRRVLAVMSVQADTPEEVSQSLRDIRTSRWRTMLDPVMVLHETKLPRTFSVRLPGDSDEIRRLRFVWRLAKERGGTTTARRAGAIAKIVKKSIVNGLCHHEIALPFPKSLPLGYHSLSLEASGPRGTQRADMTVIVVPDCGYLHERVKGSRRAWGITIQLYGLRSRHNWGIGDFRDLTGLIAWAGGELGADLLGVNPLHALPPGQVSPYSPSSRLFHHPLYLDLEGIPEFVDTPVLQAKVKAPAFQAKLAALRRNPKVQYGVVERMKWNMLDKLFQVFQRRHLARKTRRAAAFHRFVGEEGEALKRFALFRTLEERMARRSGTSRRNRRGWASWPEAYRHPDSSAVQRIAARSRSRMQFYQYVEWQCRQQLAAVQVAARRAGMAIGLYKDMAVGIDPHGADAWAFQDQLVADASIGTPPELFSPSGQRWGLAPFHPRRIRTAGYRLFADCYRRTMRDSGIIRIDHAMGLFRLFWIPEGLAPAQGTYVGYPSDDFLGILALESQRQKVMVIGEDLGTVTPAIRAQLMAGGLLSYRLLLFEQTAKGQFAKPARFPRHAAAAVATHDLPTLRGFWRGRDIALKTQLNLYTKREWGTRDLATRARDKQALLDALVREGLLPKGCPRSADAVPAMTDDLCRAIYAYLARTPSRLLLLSLEDLLGDLETPNLPGNHAYPSWRIKAGPRGSTWEDWTKLDPVRRMAQVLCRQRGSSNHRP